MIDNQAVIWDAIVVGAGPGGCAAAYDLASGGRRVLLVDKARFPRPKACAGALTMKAVRALRYSIAPVVRKSVSAAVLEPRSGGPGAAISVARSKPFCVMTIRAELDAYCLDRTRARGADFRQVATLTALEQKQDRVLLRVAGEADPLAARFVLGADGVHSRVRALSAQPGPCWFRRGFAVEANVPTMGREFPLTFDFAPVRGGYGWLFPRNDHVNVGLYTASEVAASPGAARVVDRGALLDYLAARCGGGEPDRITGQFLGLGGAAYAPSAARVLLVGDAAGLVDPLTGEGIYGAIASGQSAASAVLSSLEQGGDAASLYGERLARQRADLSISERAAAAFYREPEQGFRLMRLPLAGRAVLHAYSEGTSLAALARGLDRAGRLVRGRL